MFRSLQEISKYESTLASVALAVMLQGPSTNVGVTTVAIGEVVPAFALPAADGKSYAINDLRGKYVVLEWTNRDCPLVVRHYRSGNMQVTQKRAKEMGAEWFSVCSSAPGKQGNLTVEEFNENLKATRSGAKTVLFDFDGKIGRTFKAQTTPQIVIINPEGKMIYNGAIDDKPNASLEETRSAKNFALAAHEEAMAGKPVTVATSRPYGCGIKY